MPPKGSSSSGSRDTDWVAEVRPRQLSSRATLGQPGDERWEKFDARAQQYRELPAMQSAEGPALQRQEHDILRTDLSQGLAGFEPQADTMIVEGRPTQVT